MAADHFYYLRLILFLLACLCRLSDSRERLEAPNITYGPRNRTVATTNHAVFVCKASGNPAPKIEWFINGAKLDVANGGYLIFKMPHGSVLRLPSLSTEKHGSRIVCLASNPLGNATARANLRVISKLIPGFPRILRTGSTKIKQKGDEATLKCKSSGTPPPKTEWYKDYLPINLSDPRYMIKADRLIIRKVLEEDEGVYECMVTNIQGTVSGQVMKVYVRVRRYPPHFLPPRLKKQVKVLPGSAVNLTCVAAGSPMPEIKWRQGRNLLMTSSATKKHMGRYTLMLTDIRESGNFTCQATSSLGEVEETVQVIVKELPKPPEHVYSAEPDAKSVQLHWPYSPSPHVTSYTVVVRSKDDPSKAQGIIQYPNIMPNINGGKFVRYKLMKLTPNTRYVIRVASVSSIGRSVLSPAIEVKTKEQAPGTSPHGINAMALTTRTLKVSWYPPKIRNGEITSYKVYFTQNPNLEVNKWQVLRVNRNNKDDPNAKDTANINHLTSNATYYISVSALNTAGEGPISDHFPVKVTPGVPSRPRNFQAIVTGADSIQLAWEPPEGSENPIHNRVLNYVLQYKERGRIRYRSKELPGDKNSYLLQRLRPDTHYLMRLIARTKDGLGVEALSDGRTHEYVPTSPTIISVEPASSTSLRMRWREPNENRGDIKHYTVELFITNAAGSTLGKVRDYPKTVKKKAVSGNPGVYESYIEKLTPNTYYKVVLQAVTRKGRGDRATYRPVKTLGAVPSAPTNLEVVVKPLNVGKRNMPTLLITWKAPTVPHGKIQLYRVRIKLVAPKNKAIKLMPKQFEQNVSAKVRRNSFSTASINTYFGVTYEVRVAAKNQVDFGDEEKTQVTTDDAPPTASPMSLTVRDPQPHSLRLKWNLPQMEYQNGQIKFFQVRHFQTKNRDVTEINRNVTVTDISIENLKMNTQYSFMVRAWNSAGSGPWTNPVVYTTSKYPSPLPPTRIRIVRLSETELKVTWKLPKLLSEDRVKGFRIFYSDRDIPTDQSQWKQTDTGPIFYYTLRNLRPRTSYVVRISTINEKNEVGLWSGPIVAKNIPKFTELTVQGLNCRVVSTKQLVLNWRIPKNPTNLQQFQLTVRGRATYLDSEGKLQQHDTQKRTKSILYPERPGMINRRFERPIINLLPNTNYLLSILTVYRPNSVSKEINRRVNTSCETLHDRPLKVRPPIPVTKVNRPRLIVGLELSRVSERNGNIRYYYLIISPVSVSNRVPISTLPTEKLKTMVDFAGTPSDLPNIGANFGSSMAYSQLFALFTLRSQNLFAKGQSRTTFLIGDTRKTGPLKRDVDYIAILRACVIRDRKEVCRDSQQSAVFGSRRDPIGALGSKPTQNQGIQMVLLVGGPIVVALFLIVCVIVWCFFRRRPKMQRDLRRHIPDQSLKQPLMGSPPPPPYQPMPTDPVEMRRLNYQTPGEYYRVRATSSALACQLSRCLSSTLTVVRFPSLLFLTCSPDNVPAGS